MAVCKAEEDININESNAQNTRREWVLNPPQPPSAGRVIADSVRKTISKFSSLIGDQPKPQLVLSLFQGIFPILRWAPNYTVIKFRNDLLAGLTIASLCIPQVIKPSCLVIKNSSCMQTIILYTPVSAPECWFGCRALDMQPWRTLILNMASVSEEFFSWCSAIYEYGLFIDELIIRYECGATSCLRCNGNVKTHSNWPGGCCFAAFVVHDSESDRAFC